MKVGKREDTDIDFFNITPCGLEALSVTQTYIQPQTLASYRLEDAHKPCRSDVRKLSEFELILELNCQGWAYEYIKGSKRLPPYTKHGDRKWYYHTATMKGGINYRYLSVLVLADELFSEGLLCIHHGQPVSYYDALLKVPPGMLNEVLPRRSKKFYSDLMKAHGSKKHGTQGKVHQAPMIEDDEEGSWVSYT